MKFLVSIMLHLSDLQFYFSFQREHDSTFVNWFYNYMLERTEEYDWLELSFSKN